MKGKCINIGKPCDLAISEEIQDADPANFVCKSCGKPLVEVKGDDNSNLLGGQPEGPGGDKKKKMIIAAAGVVGIAALTFGGIKFFSQDKPATDNVEKETVVQVEDGKGNSTASIDTLKPAGQDETPQPKEPQPKPLPPTDPNHLSNYSLGYGVYTGPASDGVPDGPGGTIDVTKAYTLDLKIGGETLDFAPGDKVVNCKFRNGKLIQGFLKRKKGEGKNFNIGI